MNLRWWWLAPMSCGWWLSRLPCTPAGVTQAGDPAGPRLSVARTSPAGGTAVGAARRLRGKRHVRSVPLGQGATRSKARRTRRRRTRARRPRPTAARAVTARPGARRRRRERAHPKFGQIEARRDERDVPGLSQPRQSRGMGGQRARAPQSLVQHVPQRAQPEVAGTSAGQGDRRPQLCATCHRLQVTKTERAVAHMPVREGKMSCSSCHNPHGSISNVKNLKTGSSVAELCTSCHTEMRGPMLFEHAPVRENCATCHDPHGSSNDRMLVVRMPMLCQRCHIASRHPATLYDKDQITTNKSNRMFGRSCVNCHSNIHGSNHPSGQFFMR